jgi:hypothetical protein
MSDSSNPDRTEPRPTPRVGVRFDSDGTWSAWRGAIPLAIGLPTVTAAWEAVEFATRARPPAAPSARPTTPGRRRA